MPEQSPLPPDLQRRSQAATVETGEANARKAVAEASEAERAAATGRLKALVGDPAAGPFSGDVQLTDGAALAEANDVARKQLEDAANKIMAAVAKAIAGRTVAYLTAADGPPDLSHNSALTERTTLAHAALDGARKLSDAALGRDGEANARSMIAAPLAAVGVMLSGATALLGYLKTDFKVGGVTLTVGDRDLLVLVGRHLRQAGATVLVDGFLPTPSQAAVKEARSDILRLSQEAFLRARASRSTTPPSQTSTRRQRPRRKRA